MTIRVLHGDCLDVLPTLAAGSVQCCVTSPPYFGLRDYGVAGQIGMEPTPDAYVAALVAVFAAVRRVLRDDGVLWLNLGSSYSSGSGSNVADQLNRMLEGGSVFFTNAVSVGITGHSVGVALEHERSPDGVFPPLLASKRDGVKDRHKHLGEIADLFAHPGRTGGCSATRAVLMEPADAEMAASELQHRTIVSPDSDTQAKAILEVLRPSGAGTSEYDEAAFAIDQTDKPRIIGNICWHSAWDTFAANAISKGSEDIYLVDQAIALRNRPDTVAGLLCDFRVTKATKQKITLTSVESGLSLAISDVSQLWFILHCGSVVPYHKLLEDASRFAAALLPKQDLGVPWRVARALQEDGWILRSQIIWHKPNPMPESVTDRPTSAHEHVFLLTKNARYFYDADAVREENSNPDLTECVKHWKDRPGNGEWPSGTGGRMGSVQNGRNLRNVWSIATQPFSGAHFATMPPALAERCIRAGSKPGDTILDPFSGAGTTAMVADRLGRNGIGIELNPAFAAMAVDRVAMDAGLFAEIVDAPVPQPPEDARVDLFAPGAV